MRRAVEWSLIYACSRARVHAIWTAKPEYPSLPKVLVGKRGTWTRLNSRSPMAPQLPVSYWRWNQCIILRRSPRSITCQRKISQMMPRPLRWLVLTLPRRSWLIAVVLLSRLRNLAITSSTFKSTKVVYLPSQLDPRALRNRPLGGALAWPGPTTQRILYVLWSATNSS